MSQVSEPTVSKTDTGRRIKNILINCSMIFVAVPVLIVEFVGNRWNQKRWDWDLHEISLIKDVVVYPLVAIGLHYFLIHAKQRRVNIETSRTSNGEQDGEDLEARARRRVRIVAVSFAIGLMIGFLGIGLDLAWKGWRIFADQAVFDLVFFPFGCAYIATLGTLLPGDSFWPWLRFRFSLVALMIVIAYLALILGVVVDTRRIGFLANDYHARYKGASRGAEFHRAQVEYWTIQVEQGRQPAKTVESFRAQMFYDKMLAEKYKRAEQHAWDPVAPDPPPP